MLECGTIVYFDGDKEYRVVYSFEFNNENYVFVVNQEDCTDSMFCKFFDDVVEEVLDSNLIEQLLDKVKKVKV